MHFSNWSAVYSVSLDNPATLKIERIACYRFWSTYNNQHWYVMALVGADPRLGQRHGPTYLDCLWSFA